jgi:hypothetical protein
VQDEHNRPAPFVERPHAGAVGRLGRDHRSTFPAGVSMTDAISQA